MSKLSEKVQTILENWHGEDDAGRREPKEVAQEIDLEMQRYLASLPEKNTAIAKGQQANERRVA